MLALERVLVSEVKQQMSSKLLPIGTVLEPVEHCGSRAHALGIAEYDVVARKNRRVTAVLKKIKCHALLNVALIMNAAAEQYPLPRAYGIVFPSASR